MTPTSTAVLLGSAIGGGVLVGSYVASGDAASHLPWFVGLGSAVLAGCALRRAEGARADLVVMKRTVTVALATTNADGLPATFTTSCPTRLP